MIQQLFKRRAGIFGMMCLLTISLSSCLKDHHDDYVQPSVALVSAINAVPDLAAADFYLDQNRGNNQPIATGTSMDYINVYTGKRTFTFTSSGTTTKVKSDTTTFKANTGYSVFISNVAAKADYLITVDSIARPATGMATVRFVNLSPNAGATDLAITGGNVVATNKAYRTVSSFVPVQGDKAYTFEVRNAGTANVISTLPSLTLRSGSVYTIWVQGIAGATDQTKLSTRIQNNVYYY
ncbi:DUF4397 domain-containing protein [Mucilaginibacter sp. KACC 22063]|uniref:DUF4397 domain-containing protein n=1 Tax=Mucilaginibacter sp. KACC 22063 TaxID=3025666 RepID=UPI0023655F8B|nr:DUF4397 domain-containing protein [Mucilaginibacter sp. KACC 22063]WDF56064.1 DUF4397 domain-containing protein [Mucilaginibacter sp. KACC 22063]